MLLLQEDDETLQFVRQAVERKEKPTDLTSRALPPDARHYLSMFDRLFIGSDGLLRLHKPGNTTLSRKPVLCLPADTWDKVIKEVHRAGGHCGINSTTERFCRSFYIPRVKCEVMDVLKACEECQQKQLTNKPQRHTLISVLEGYPFQKISIDFVGPLHEVRGKKYVFTARDCFSKWLEATAVKSATAEAAISFLVNDVFRRFGIPETIHSDNGSHFTSRMLGQVATSLGIRTTRTPVYHPASNPVERAHRDLNDMLRAIGVETGQDWVTCLPAALMAMNTNVHSGTKFSPFQLLFGRDPPLPIEIAFAKPEDQKEVSTKVEEYANDIKKRIQMAYKYARENLKMAVERRRNSYLKAKQGYEPGDLAWLFTPVSKPNVARKLQNHWSGPWTVTRALSAVLYEILAPPNWNLPEPRQVVAIDRLAPFRLTEPEDVPPEEAADLRMEGDEFVERPDVKDEDDSEEPDNRTLTPHSELEDENTDSITEEIGEAAAEPDEVPDLEDEEVQPLDPQLQEPQRQGARAKEPTKPTPTPAKQLVEETEARRHRRNRSIAPELRPTMVPRRNLFPEPEVTQPSQYDQETSRALESGRPSRARMPARRDPSFEWDFQPGWRKKK